MNKRIKELAEQALTEISKQDKKTQTETYDTFTNKFAELIVRECAIIADQPSGWGPGYNIRKHFGVEE